MTTHRIAVIPGDMIGPEVIEQGLRVLTALQDLGYFGLDFTEFPWGAGHYLQTGTVAPVDLPHILAPFDAVYFGAHGIPDMVPDRISGSHLVHRMRSGLDLNVNLRPLRYFPGTPSPLAHPEDVDYVIVRENTEGEYSHIGGRLHAGTEEEMATELTVVTRRATDRVMRYAFNLARTPGRRGHVTCVTKSNALGHSMSLWDEVFAEVAADYPDVTTSKALVDAMTMYLVTRPRTLDVLVTTNLMGDILSDEGAALTGSIGLAASGNLNLTRRYPSVFEPCHGSAPDIAGLGIANPLAAILSAALMLDWLGEAAAAEAVRKAVDGLLLDGSTVTPDLGGTARTEDVGTAVIERLAPTAA